MARDAQRQPLQLSSAMGTLAGEVENAQNALDGDSNDAEFEALWGLVRAARAVIAAWDS